MRRVAAPRARSQIALARRSFVYRGCQREFPSIVELQLRDGGGAGDLVGNPEPPGSGLSGERCLARTEVHE